MWRQILYIWVIVSVSATSIEREQLSTISLNDAFNFVNFVWNALWKNSTENKFPYENESLQFLKQKIVDGLYSPSRICDSPYNVACGWNINSHQQSEWNHDRSQLKHQLFLLKNQIENLLAKPILKTDTKSLIIEKQLYQDCLLIGKKPPILKSQNIIDYTLSDFIVNVTQKSWQQIDQKLELMGFNRTFFTIGVTENSRTKKKMLLLQPPSSIELVDNFESLSEMMNLLQFQSNHKKEVQLAKHFFVALNKANPDKFTFDIMTIPEWYDYYLQGNGGQGSQSSEIYWYELFHSAAEYYNVRLENVVVKNKEYFQELERLLRLFSQNGDHTASFVSIKWLFNNLYYINWNAFNQLHPQSKNSFCLQKLNLYGVSQVVLRSLEEDTDIKYLLETVKSLFFYIVQTIDIEIMMSQNLKETEKIKLRSFLHDITAPILHNQTYSSAVDNLYGDFKITHNYLQDITEYRKKVYTEETKFIDIYGTPEKLPFNINDLNRPQNRLLLKAYLRMSLIASPHLHKEYHFAVYGSEMSRFIYDLVINKKFGFKEIHHNDEEWLYTSVQYPNELKSCLLGKIPNHKIDTVISEVIALKTAHRSMEQSYYQDSTLTMRKPFKFDNGVVYSEDAMFILAYLKSHCYWTENVGSYILQNFAPFASAFGCDFRTPQCDIELF